LLLKIKYALFSQGIIFNPMCATFVFCFLLTRDHSLSISFYARMCFRVSINWSIDQLCRV